MPIASLHNAPPGRLDEFPADDLVEPVAVHLIKA
jgi:hypothetical protein